MIYVEISFGRGGSNPNRPLKKRLFSEFAFDWSSFGYTRVIGKPWNQRAYTVLF